MSNQKICPVCGDKVIGRTDKKYCSDQCRSEFNNRSNRYTNNYIRRINGILRRNRRILEELNPNVQAKIPAYKLLGKGFSFNHFTGIYRTRSGETYYFCYEMGYLPLEDNYYLITRKDE